MKVKKGKKKRDNGSASGMEWDTFPFGLAVNSWRVVVWWERGGEGESWYN